MTDQLLEEIYYNPQNPASYGGVQALSKESGVSVKNVEKWLKSQSAYTLHKPARKRYLTRPYRVSGIDQLWQVDLADMQPLAPQNDGYRFILTVIDIFSRKGWAKAVKIKKNSRHQTSIPTNFS